MEIQKIMKIEIEVPDSLGNKMALFSPEQRFWVSMALYKLYSHFEAFEAVHLPNFSLFSEKEKLALLDLLYLWFVPLTSPIGSVMKTMSQEAAANGLTPEILDQMLHDED